MKTREAANETLERIQQLRKENAEYQSVIMTAVQRMHQNTIELAMLAEGPMHSIIYADRAAKENA